MNSTSPPEVLLHLVFHGECLEGHDPMAVRLAVAEALKLDPARTARLFSGQRIVMRRDVTPARAKAHIQRFAAMGARLRLESPSPSLSPAPSPTRPADPPRSPAGPGQPEAAVPALPSLPSPTPRTPRTSLTLRTLTPVPGPAPDGAGASVKPLGNGLRPAAVAAGLLVLGLVLAWATGLMSAAPPDASAPMAVVETAAPAPQAVPMAAGVVSTEGSAPAQPPAASAPPFGLPSAALPPGPPASPTAEDGPPSDMGPEARQEHRTRYLAAKQRRAFAISSSGAFGWIGGMPSEAEARERALAQCMSRLPAGDGGCRVVHADAEWLE